MNSKRKGREYYKCGALIKYCYQPALIMCDGKCNIAWGLSKYNADGLRPEYVGKPVPRDTGVSEGTDSKPRSSKSFPNRWCVRECERSRMVDPRNFFDGEVPDGLLARCPTCNK